MAQKHNILWIAIGIMIALLFFSPFALWYKGGSELSPSWVVLGTGEQYPFAPVLFYRGIKIPGSEEPVVLFKRFYAIFERDPSTGLMTYVTYKQDGYNSFETYYASGQIAADGKIKVEFQSLTDEIVHDMHDVANATYYDLEGNLVSEIKNGTGVQILSYPDGVKQCELELENYQRKSLKIWLQDGTLRVNKLYSSDGTEMNAEPTGSET